jgi:aspartyl-tRNA synthetase
MKKIYNTEVTIDSVDKEVHLAGWVAKKRDLGGLIFIDLRDKTGIIQLVISPENKNYEIASTIKNEYVIDCIGKVVKRSNVNKNLITGEIEIEVEELTILSTCNELPFPIADQINTSDDNRLKYRFLDIRRNKLRENLTLRSEILHYLRNKMYDLGFTEVQTPILTASSPEGARDFVVPSRLYKGKFYALPQAPQIYKELLMVGGFNKYFQIAPCFRDEDARADRTLEFYQLDLEMSFVEEEDVLEVGESIFYDTFTKFSNKTVSPRPFRRISYRDAIDTYGTDKPDLRYGLEIQDITEIFKNTEFTVFKDVINSNGIINGILVPNGSSSFSRKEIDKLTEFVKSKKASGLAYLKFDTDITGSIAKVVTPSEIDELKSKLNINNGDILFIVSGDKKIVKPALGALRIEVANFLDIIPKDRLELCIVNDFPMFEFDEQKGKWDFCHNPFSLPHGGAQDYEEKSPEEILAYQYDFVCNGNEMASGAIRNHDLDSLAKGFEIVGYTREEVETRFKSIFTAFKYGCPPHGGMAPGIDRIIMLIQDEPNLREVQAFPPNASGQDLMMGSPSTLTQEQLDELGISINKEDDDNE